MIVAKKIAVGLFLVSGAVVGRRLLEPRAPQAASEIAWASGRESVYALDWSTATTSKVGEGPVESNVEIRGSLVLSSYGPTEAGNVLLARFEDLTHVRVHAMGKPLLPDLATAKTELERKSVEIVVKPSGEIVDVRFRPQDPALFRYLMTAVVKELDLRMGTEVATTDGPSGSGPARFQRDATDPRVVKRTRERYDVLSAWPVGATPEQDLTSEATLRIGPEGALEGVRSNESLTAGGSGNVVSTSSFVLTKSTERAFDARTRPEGYEAAPPSIANPPSETEELKRARLEARTEGVSVESVLEDVRVNSLVPKTMSTRWAWVASAYFELYPEKAHELLPKMKGELLDTKALAIDVLMMVGHADAQRAITRALDDQLATGPENGFLLQRLARIERPTPETAEWVAARYARAKSEDDLAARRGAALALGGIIAGVAKTDRSLARSLDDALVLDLHATRDPKEREVLLLALGNASLPEDAIAIRLSAHDETTEVRLAVATALRRIDSPEIRRTLLGLFGDADAHVQMAALSSLDRRELSSDELGAMQATLEDGRVKSLVTEPLVNFLAPRRELEEARAMLDLIAQNEQHDPRTRARAFRVLDGS